MTGTVRRSRWMAAFAAALMVSGCWSSDEPMMTATDSEQPIPSGSYIVHGQEDSDTRVTLIRFPGGGYIWSVPDEGAIPVLARTVAPGWMILQSGFEDDDYLYSFAEVSATSVTVYDPQLCPNDLAGITGMTLESPFDCRFDTLDALVDAARKVLRSPGRSEVLGNPILVLALDSREAAL